MKGGTKETGGLFGLCAGSRAQNQQGVTGTGWERRLEGDQMRLLGHLPGGTCGASWTETKMDQVPEVNTAISPRVKQGTEPEMVIATAMDRGPTSWGVENHLLMEAPT